MKTYEIRAEYRVTKTLEVVVPDDADPLDPSVWTDIVSEHDIDCWLDEVDVAHGAELVDDTGEVTAEGGGYY